MKQLTSVLLLGLMLVAVSCNHQKDHDPDRTIEISKQQQSNTPTNGGSFSLLFFMNPAGLPCQIQDKILKELPADVRAKVQVSQIRTDITEDHAQFNKFGIQALPSIIILSPSGEEYKRFSPGIRSKEELIETISKI